MKLGRVAYLYLILAGAMLIPAHLVAPVWAAVSVDVVHKDGQKEEVDLYTSSHALVIGIDQYTEGWPLLSNAVKDANAVAAALEERGFDVTLLVNLNRDELIAALRSFFIVKGDDPEARLMLWFAGHGHTENNEGFIIPADGAEPEAGAKFRLSAVPMRDVSTYVRLAQSKHVLTIFDSCFSGTVFSTSRSKPPKVISMASTRPVRQFISSGDAFQQVTDDGTFRELFLGALNGEEDADLNGDGFVTGTELGFFMTSRMTDLTEGRQTPRYGKLRDKDFDRGDYVFASLRPLAPQFKSPSTSPAAAPDQSQRYSPELETAFWTSIQGSDEWQDYQAYVDRFGDQGAFTDLAKRRVKRLKSREEAAKADNVPALRVIDPVEQAYWDAVKDSPDWQDYQSYIDKYGQSGVYFQLAWQRYGQLRTEENKTFMAAQEAERIKAAQERELAEAAAKEMEEAAKAKEAAELAALEAEKAKAAKEIELAALPPEVIETTPAPQQPAVLEPVVDPLAQNKAVEAQLRMSRGERQRIQQALTALGYSTRGVDGMFGRNSRRAISSYQRKRGLEPTGYLDGALRRRILSEAPPPPQPRQQVQQQAQQQPKAQPKNDAQAAELAKLQRQLRKLQEKEKQNAQTALNVPKSRTARPIDGRWQLRVQTIVTQCAETFSTVSAGVDVSSGSFSRGFRKRNKSMRIKGRISNGQVRLSGSVILLPTDDVRGETNIFDTSVPFGPNGISARVKTLREGSCNVVLDVKLTR